MPDYITAPYTNSTLGFDLSVQIPANLTELSKAFPAEDVFSAAVRQSFYNGWNNKFRPALGDHVEKKLSELHGREIKRRQKTVSGTPITKTKKDGTEEAVLESEKTFLAWVVEEKLVDEATLAIWAQEVANTIPFKVAKAEEEAQPSKEFFAIARNILAKAEAGSVGESGAAITEESFIANFNSLNPGHDTDALGGWTEIGIARMVEINQKRMLQAGGGLC